jgi:polyisoprenoid-binding protein YceI
MTAPTSPPSAGPPAPPARRRRRWPWFLGGAVALVILLAVGGPFVYIHFIQADPPAKLTFENADANAPTTTAGSSSTSAAAGAASTPATTASAGAGAATGSIDGTWAATSASEAGYRVKEVLFGQSAEAVGRTNAVTGQLAMAGTTVNSGSFSVDMTTVKSDESRRDDQFNGRIMDTSRFPTATFKLTQPIAFGSLPPDKTQITAKATGDLTLRGVTKSVTFDVTARRNGADIEVSGSIPIVFADYSIPNPTTAGITTQDNGVIEFLLVFAKA